MCRGHTSLKVSEWLIYNLIDLGLSEAGLAGGAVPGLSAWATSQQRRGPRAGLGGSPHALPSLCISHCRDEWDGERKPLSLGDGHEVMEKPHTPRLVELGTTRPYYSVRGPDGLVSSSWWDAGPFRASWNISGR